MNPGQLVALWQVSHPGFNFESVYDLIPFSVHINFSSPLHNFERRVTRSLELGNLPYRGNFLRVNQRQKSPGASVGLRMPIIKARNKFHNIKFQKAAGMVKRK